MAQIKGRPILFSAPAMAAVIAAATLAACATPAAVHTATSPITDAERVQAYCAAALMPPGFADLCKPEN